MLANWMRRKSLRARIAHWVLNAADDCEPELANAVYIVRAIFMREQIEEITTLRQMHIVTQLSQAEAFKAIEWLQDQELIVVRDNPADRFESELVLSHKLRRTLEAGQSRTAA